MIASITTSATITRISAIATPVSPTWIALGDQEHHVRVGELHRWPGDLQAARLGLVRQSPPVWSVHRTHCQQAIRRLLLQQPLDPWAQEPPRPPKPTRRQLAAAG
jgi:hypothetical protein